MYKLSKKNWLGFKENSDIIRKQKMGRNDLANVVSWQFHLNLCDLYMVALYFRLRHI